MQLSPEFARTRIKKIRRRNRNRMRLCLYTSILLLAAYNDACAAPAGILAPSLIAKEHPTITPAPGPPRSFAPPQLVPMPEEPGVVTLAPAGIARVSPTLSPAVLPRHPFDTRMLMPYMPTPIDRSRDGNTARVSVASSNRESADTYDPSYGTSRYNQETGNNGVVDSLSLGRNASDLGPFAGLAVDNSKTNLPLPFNLSIPPQGAAQVGTKIIDVGPHRLVAPIEPSATIEGSMETFVVERPAGTTAPVDPNAIFQPTLWHVKPPRPVMEDMFDGEITYSASGGIDPVSVSLNGVVEGSQFQSSVDPSELLSPNVLHDNSLVVSQKGQGIDIGGNGGGVPDAGTGIRLFKPMDGTTGVAGFGLYQRIGTTGLSLIPGVDAQFATNKTHSVDVALAADSSVRLSEQTKSNGWMTNSFLGWNAIDKQSQDSFSVSRKFNQLFVSQGVSFVAGKGSGFGWTQSFAQRFGATDFNVQSSIEKASTSSEELLSMSMLRPVGRNLLSVRWIGEGSKADGTANQSQLLSTNFMLPTKTGGMMLVSDTLSQFSGGGMSHISSVSDNWELGRAYTLSLGINHDWRSSTENLAGSVGVWLTPDWQARVMVGAETDQATGVTQSSLIGFQLVNRFHLITYGTGTIHGSVLLDGQPADEPIRMQMEDRFVTTDKHGNFDFDRANVGQHDVGFDMSSLPADINPRGEDQVVKVEHSKTVDVVFNAERIGLVTGKIDVDADVFGKTDPTAGSGIVLTDSAGHETTSNSDNTYTLGDLPLGKHTISVLPTSLPPGYEVVGTQSFDVVVKTEPAASNVDFHIAPHQNIEMTVIGK